MKIHRKNKKEGHSPTWLWKATGPSLDKFVEMIDGYLVLKGKQLETMRSFRAVRPRGTTKPITDEEYGRQVECMLRMRKLNERGVGK